ncbi:Sodium/hydrogen exchanger family-domain-containing protein [Syncephalis fuscata]|nr:Sodium/hydrogen exchanger family-domain-containing protein [Syncephalis fuscata]
MVAIHLETVSVVFAVLGLFILIFGLISMPIKEWLYLSEALVATIFGIIIGPSVSGVVHIEQWGDTDTITREYSRIVIALSVAAAGISLPKAYIVKEWRSLFTLLFPVMLIMWLVGAAFIYAFLPLTFVEALMIAACITPTDPVLANSVVKGRFADQYVPDHVRNIISAESGANDGLGFPYLFFAIYLIRYASPGEAVGKWVYEIVLYQIVLSLAIGIAVGYIARKLLYFAQSRELIDKESFLAFSFALTMFIMGSVYIIGSDDLFAVFVASNSFTWDDWFRSETQEAHLQEVVDMLFNLSFFVYFGAIIPWPSFQTAHDQLSIWRLVVISILILLFRRLPAVLMLQWFIPTLRTWREAAFAGWFGPMGVGALFFAMLAIEEMDKDDYQGNARNLLFPVVSFIVLASVVVHGITVPVFQLSTSNLTRTLTNPAAIAHLVQRLPLIRPGQEIIIRRTDNTTEITISRPNSVCLPESFNEELVATSEMAEQTNSNPSAGAAGRRSRELLRRQSHLSQHSIATRRSMRSGTSYIEETHTFTHGVAEDNEEDISNAINSNSGGSIEIITVKNTVENAK